MTYEEWGQQRCRPACVFTQSVQHICCNDLEQEKIKTIIKGFAA